MKPEAPHTKPGTEATSPRGTLSHTQQWEGGIAPRGCQTFQAWMGQKEHGRPWHSHGFLAGGEICKLRYGLLSESSRRLYFWRPPRTRSRRTPVGEGREKLSGCPTSGC